MRDEINERDEHLTENLFLSGVIASKLSGTAGIFGIVFANITSNMLFLLSVVLSVGSVGALALLIGKAPEAYETGSGLQVIHSRDKIKLRTAARLPVAQIMP